MNVFDLTAKLSLDTTAYEAALGAAKGMAGGVGTALKTAAKVGMAAVGAASAATVAFAKSAVDAGMDFDASMSQVAATMGKTLSELEQETGSVETAFGSFNGTLREFAQYMGSNTAFSATEAADALNYMALAGYKAQESMEMLPNVLSLAAAGSMDLALASDMVTDTQTAFGISFERTSQLVDEMAKAASTGNTSVTQLGEAFLTVGGLAQELNGGFIQLEDGSQASVDGIQELEIALTAMANAGIKGSEAGTHMRNMLLKLSSPTKDGVAQLQALGVKVFDTEGNMRSLRDVMGDLSVALGSLTQEDKINAISDLFNTRDLASAEALLNAVGQDWDGIGESILDAQGAAAQMADTQLDNLAGDITLFKSALEGAKIAVSDQLTPSLRDFVKFGTNGLSTLTEAFKSGGLSGAMEAFGGILSQGLNMIIENLPMMVDAGMRLLGALGQGLVDNIDVLLDSATQVVTMLVDGLLADTEGDSKFGEVAIKILSTIGQLIMDNAPLLLEAGINMLTSLGQFISENASELASYVSDFISDLVDMLIENAPALIEAAIEMVSSLATGLAENAPKLLPKVADLVVTIVEKLTEPHSLNSIISAALQIIVSLAEGLIAAIPRLVAAIPQIISNLVGTIVASIPEIIATGIRLIVALALGLVQAIPQIVAAIPSLIFAIVGGLVQGVKEIVNVGGQLVAGLWEGIKGSWQNMVQNFKDLVGGLVDNVKGWFGVHSPSTLFAEIGKNLDEGLAIGITRNIDTVDDAFGDLEDYTEISPRVALAGAGGGSLSASDSGIDSLSNAVLEALRGVSIEVMIGQERLDGMITKAIQRTNYRSGGR